jgi:hypothetical protein
MQSSFILQDVIRVIVQREAVAILTTIQTPKKMHKDHADEQEIQALPYVSVEDTLRLPLTGPAGHTNHCQMLSTLPESAAILPETPTLEREFGVGPKE